MPGGWHWYAYGIIHSGTRFWVYINDQHQGNWWYNTTSKIARIDTVGSITAFSAEPFKGVRRVAVKILRTKFSDADFEYDKDQPSMLVFRRTMREFVIYGLNKTGDWQKPMTVQAPDRGGLSVRYYIKRGTWEGALEVPYSGAVDHDVFRETHIVKNSEDGN